MSLQKASLKALFQLKLCMCMRMQIYVWKFLPKKWYWYFKKIPFYFLMYWKWNGIFPYIFKVTIPRMTEIDLNNMKIPHLKEAKIPNNFIHCVMQWSEIYINSITMRQRLDGMCTGKLFCLQNQKDDGKMRRNFELQNISWWNFEKKKGKNRYL